MGYQIDTTEPSDQFLKARQIAGSAIQSNLSVKGRRSPSPMGTNGLSRNCPDLQLPKSGIFCSCWDRGIGSVPDLDEVAIQGIVEKTKATNLRPSQLEEELQRVVGAIKSASQNQSE
jgi:hypothetical protein